jgi:NTP pyrophosphatase (non-canonical NTP hydrolase)
MNRREYLMQKLGQEACEVAQMASKNNEFGMFEVFPDQPLTNAERLHLELDDLMAMIEMLNDEFNLGYVPNRDNMDAKKRKVEKYYAHSDSLGLINT